VLQENPVSSICRDLGLLKVPRRKQLIGLPAPGDDRSRFPGHLQHLDFHQVGNTLRLQVR